MIPAISHICVPSLRLLRQGWSLLERERDTRGACVGTFSWKERSHKSFSFFLSPDDSASVSNASIWESTFSRPWLERVSHYSIHHRNGSEFWERGIRKEFQKKREKWKEILKAEKKVFLALAFGVTTWVGNRRSIKKTRVRRSKHHFSHIPILEKENRPYFLMWRFFSRLKVFLSLSLFSSSQSYRCSWCLWTRTHSKHFSFFDSSVTNEMFSPLPGLFSLFSHIFRRAAVITFAVKKTLIKWMPFVSRTIFSGRGRVSRSSFGNIIHVRKKREKEQGRKIRAPKLLFAVWAI